MEASSIAQQDRDDSLGMATWKALVYQSLPLALLIGVNAADNDLSVVLVVSLFMSVLPESFSSAFLMRDANVPAARIMTLWVALSVLTSLLAATVAWAMPGAQDSGLRADLFSSAVEGGASGAWLVYITGVMLPKAYETRTQWTGLLT